jgi:hypothetical protein
MMHIQYPEGEFFAELSKTEYDAILFEISRNQPFFLKREKLNMCFFPHQIQRIQFTL